MKAFRLDILPEQVARLADALRRLATSVPEHPGIVPVLDAGLEGTTAYLASEYVAAETLDVALRHLAPAPLARALPILTKLADAIDAAWATGSGHGAIHPRDVFVTVDSQEVRLTGVGVVPALESIGVKAPVRRPYAAPERVNGEAWDVRADVYALGAIAHELLTRRRPAGSGEQDGALTTDTSAEQRVQIRRVLSAVLAERPQHRFPSARAFTDALDAVARGEAVSTFPEVETIELEEEPAQEATQVLSPAALAPLLFAEPPASVDAPSAPDASAATPARSEPDLPTAPLAVSPAPQPVVEPEPTVLVPQVAPAPIVSAAPMVAAPGPRGLYAPRAMDPVVAPRPAARESAPPVVMPVPMPQEFPWSAFAAACAATLVVGLTVGYWWGKSRVDAPPTVPTIATAQPSAAETEVRMPQDPVPAAAPTASDEPAPVSRTPLDAARGVPNDGRRAAVERGRLVIRSVPQGALVVVDGRPRGQTPATLTDLTFGDHTVEVARSGFVPYSERVTLTAGTPLRTVSVRLQAGIATGPADPSAPEALTGSLFVDSRPQGARVIIDGRFAGVTPLRVPGVRIGRHEVRIEREGFQAFTSSTDVKSGEQSRVTAALEERQF